MRNKRYTINLPAHMAECDTNYLRIQKLFPTLSKIDRSEFAVRLGHGEARVQMEVIERSPYTTLLRLLQCDGAEGADPASDNAGTAGLAARPRLTVRLYHDARCAEVVDYQRARHFSAVYEYPNPGMRYPDEKAQVNRFLGEFLSLCLDCGIVTDSALAAASPAPTPSP